MIRYLLMPGTDIFTRRRIKLEKYWKKGPRTFLDAGFGNGWFAYRAWKSGAHVTAVAIQPELIEKAQPFYNDFLSVPEQALEFKQFNLYQLPELNQTFDEIICYETLEHILGDEHICQHFYNALNPGGVLHLCCPNSEHPRWADEELDLEEQGGHVRYGYTLEDYQNLLEPIGFTISVHEGVGGASLVALQENWQMTARRFFGEFGALIVAWLAVPFVWFDSKTPKVPFSVYVKATRPSEGS